MTFLTLSTKESRVGHALCHEVVLDGSSSKESILNVAEERIELRKFAPEFAPLPTQVGAAPGPQGENNENR
jgi:hypothetical protein